MSCLSLGKENLHHLFDKIIISKYLCLFTLVCHWQQHASIWECFSAGTSQTKINTGVVCWRADVNTSDVTDTHCNKQNHKTMIWD